MSKQVVRQPRKRAVVLNIETQTEDGGVIALCHINEKVISLRTSRVARIMFRKNRSLFDKINNSTRLIGGALYRQEVETPKESVNSLSTPIFNSYRGQDKEISQLFFENNVLKKQVRAISKAGRKFDYDPSKVSEENASGGFDDKLPSPDDISESQTICSVEEITLFQNVGIKTLLITDTLQDTSDLLEVGYRIEILVENEFKNFLDYVLKQSLQSIFFLSSYLNSLNVKSNYDQEEQSFTKDFSDRILQDLGLLDNQSLDTQKIKESDFGKAALSFYNLRLLLAEGDTGDSYSDVLRTILPTFKTNPRAISSFLSNFSSLYDQVSREYGRNSKETKKERNKFSRSREGKTFKNTIRAKTTEKMELEQEKLGYSVFSETQTGLGKFSVADYGRRFSQERTKHYPTLDVSDASNFLTPPERLEFSRVDNAPAFLTPTSMIMGEERIKTNRGIKNIPINKVREFRLAKSSRYIQKNSTRKPTSSSKARIAVDTMSSFNVTISRPKIPLLTRSTEENIDPLEDAKHYVGSDSFFVSNNPFEFRRQFKRILKENDRKILGIVSDIVPRRFLRNKKAIKSIKEIQFSNPKSRVRKMATAEQLRISEIPPHVKFMMSNAFNPNPNSDPMKNNEAREIIEETQKNLFMVKALVGFEKDSQGFLDLRNPIYEEMSSKVLSSGNPILAKAFDYEIPELGIVKDNFAATIYNNLIYIRG
jgi:hypothetical protein